MFSTVTRIFSGVLGVSGVLFLIVAVKMIAEGRAVIDDGLFAMFLIIGSFVVVAASMLSIAAAYVYACFRLFYYAFTGKR